MARIIASAWFFEGRRRVDRVFAVRRSKKPGFGGASRRADVRVDGGGGHRVHHLLRDVSRGGDGATSAREPAEAASPRGIVKRQPLDELEKVRQSHARGVDGGRARERAKLGGGAGDAAEDGAGVDIGERDEVFEDATREVLPHDANAVKRFPPFEGFSLAIVRRGVLAKVAHELDVSRGEFGDVARDLGRAREILGVLALEELGEGAAAASIAVELAVELEHRRVGVHLDEHLASLVREGGVDAPREEKLLDGGLDGGVVSGADIREIFEQSGLRGVSFVVVGARGHEEVRAPRKTRGEVVVVVVVVAGVVRVEVVRGDGGDGVALVARVAGVARVVVARLLEGFERAHSPAAGEVVVLFTAAGRRRRRVERSTRRDARVGRHRARSATTGDARAECRRENHDHDVSRASAS